MSSGPILIGVEGPRLTSICRDNLQHPAVGGVVLFTRNYQDPEQLELLIESIQASRPERLLVAIDQEGGRVQRLRESFTRLPALGALGAIFEREPEFAADMAYRHGRVMATEMLAYGIDLSFAPVLDLDRGSSVIGDRALAGDPASVITLGRSYIAGMHDAGMKTTGKHFPGHGSVHADSHHSDVRDDRSLDEIRNSDLLPFSALQAELDALMIAHVVYPEVDPLPAGYSEIWLKQILRDEIAYRGVIMSDDLGMHAAKMAGSLKKRTMHCLQAGCDLVLVCHTKDVNELLSALDAELDAELDAVAMSRANEAIKQLYGQPTLTRSDLDSVSAEGIGEWAQWQESLEQLA